MSNFSESENSVEWAVKGPPVGVWKTCQGTFDAVMPSVLFFNPDGTGWIESSSFLSGPDRTAFKWTFYAEGRLGMELVFDGDDFDDTESNADDKPYFEYVADIVEIDIAGAQVCILRNKVHSGFWMLDAPISLVSSVIP